jgi:uncharacterized protein
MLRASTLVAEVAPPRPHGPAVEHLAQRPAEPLKGPSGRVFLTAQWRYLAILNWQIDPGVLRPLLPPGLELDLHHGKAYVSMVGFQFLDARLLGLPIPFHRNFEEVNLRFYVLRRVGGQIRRGVVFVKEICPRWAVSSVARWVYNEQYVTLPMRHHVTIEAPPEQHSPLEKRPCDGEELAHPNGFQSHSIDGGRAASLSPTDGIRPPATTSPHLVPRPKGKRGAIDVEYAWRRERAWHRLSLRASGAASPPPGGSLEEFVIEHYWAYTRQRDGGCVEYRVAHRPWHVWPVRTADLSADVEPLYGRELAEVIRREPVSAILADGSPVKVYRGARM